MQVAKKTETALDIDLNIHLQRLQKQKVSDSAQTQLQDFLF
jgi:hypothetical protein